MKKVLFALAAMLTFAVVEVRADMDDSLSHNETTMVVSGSNVRVSGANGQTLEVFKITGERVMTLKVDADQKSINLNLPKGCYILRVGKLTRKVSVC